MATLVLGLALPNVLGLTAGTAAFAAAGFGGALIGSILDNRLIFPLLFGGGDAAATRTTTGQRLGGVTLGNGTEGAPIPMLAGGYCRVPCVIIDVSDIRKVEEVRSTRVEVQTSGGKGGGGDNTIVQDEQQITYKYYVDLVLLIADTRISGAVVELSKLILNGKVLYAKFNDVNIDDAEIGVQNQKFLQYESIYNREYWRNTDIERRIDIGESKYVADTGGGEVDLEAVEFFPNAAITVSGFSEGGNNGDKTFVDSGTYSSGQNAIVVLDLGACTGGTFAISYGGWETALMNFDVDAATLQQELEDLPSIGSGNVSVDTNPISNYDTYWPGANRYARTITFQGSLAATPISNLTVSTNNLTYPTNPLTSQEPLANTPILVTTQPGVPTGATYVRIAEELVDEGFTTPVDIVQVVPDLDPRLAESIQIYGGWNDTVNQGVLTEMQARHGAADTPHHINSAVIEVKNLALTDFGNSIPYQINAIVDASRDGLTTLDQFLDRLFTFVFPPDGPSWDLTNLTGITIDGLQWVGPQEISRLVETIMVAYRVNVRVSNDTLVFFLEGQEDVVVIDANHLAAHIYGEEIPTAVYVGDAEELEISGTVNVTHTNIEKDGQPATQTYIRINSLSNDYADISLETLTMTPSVGHAIAKRLAWEPNQDRQIGDVAVTPRYFPDLAEGTITKVTGENGETFKIRSQRVETGENFVTMVHGPIRDAALLDFTSDSDAEEDDTENPYIPPAVTLYVLDLPALRDIDNLEPGFYAGIAALEYSARWQGSVVYISEDDITYLAAFDLSSETVSGYATTQLVSASSEWWDEANTVTVKLRHGTLSSKTKDEVLNGANRALLNGEIIAFRTATLVDTNTYELSGLMRGLRNTEAAMDLHNAGDRFVLLDRTTMRWQQITENDVNRAVYFRGVASGDDVANATTVSHRYRGQTLVPFSPSHFTSARDLDGGTDDVIFNWYRRDRSVVRVFGVSPMPNLEPTETYRLSIVDPSTYEVINTYEITDATTYTYTVAQQTTDGVNGASFIATVAQIGSVVIDAGRPASLTVPAP